MSNKTLIDALSNIRIIAIESGDINVAIAVEEVIDFYESKLAPELALHISSISRRGSDGVSTMTDQDRIAALREVLRRLTRQSCNCGFVAYQALETDDRAAISEPLPGPAAGGGDRRQKGVL